MRKQSNLAVNSARLILLGFNLLAIYLFLPSKGLLNATWLFVISGVILLGWSYRSHLKRSKFRGSLKKGINTFIGSFGSALHYVRMNKQYILISSVGLMIAVAGVTQAFMVVNVQQDKLLEVATSSIDRPGLLIGGHTATWGVEPLPTNFVNNLNSFLDAKEETVRDHLKLDYYHVEKTMSFITIQGLEYLDTSIDYLQKNVELFTLDQSVLVSLINSSWGGLEGRLPVNENETIAIKASNSLPDVQPSFEVGMNLTVDYPLGLGHQFHGEVIPYQLTVVGVVDLPTIYSNPIIPEIDELLQPIVFYVTPKTLVKVFNQYNEKAYTRFYRAYFYDYGSDDVVAIRENLLKLLRYGSLYFNNAQLSTFQVRSVKSPYASSIEWVANLIGPMKSLFLFLSVPIAGIVVFLVDLAFNLVEPRKRRFIAWFKNRGASPAQLVSATLLEIMISSVIGLILGVLLAFPISWILMKSSGFLQFQNQIGFPYISVKQLITITYVGLILGFDYNLPNLMDVAKTSIVEGETPVELRKPFWRKYQLDILALGIGIWFSYIVNYIVTTGKQNVSASNLIYLGALALFFTIVGGVMLGSWYFSGFVSQIGGAIENIVESIMVLAFRNIKLRRMTTSKLLALLMSSTAFLIFLIALPVSFQVYAVEQDYYKIGSDLVIEDADWRNPTFNGIMNNVKGVKEYSVADYYVFQAEYNAQRIRVAILGINTSSYADVAYFKDSYAYGRNLSAIVQDLNIPLTAYVWDQSREEISLQVGTTMELDYIGLSSDFDRDVLNTTRRFYLKGEFAYWPRLVLSTQVHDALLLVTSLHTSELLKESVGLSNIYFSRPFVLVKAQDNMSLVDVKDEIFNDSVGKYRFTGIHYIGEQLIGSYFGAVFISINSLITMGFLYAILVSVLTIGVYSRLTISERKQEVGLLKALGGTRNQLALIFINEVFVLLLTAIPLGVFLGLAMITVTLNILVTPGFGGDVPPITVIYPVKLLTLSVLAVSFIAFLGALHPAIKFAQTKPGLILRAEE